LGAAARDTVVPFLDVVVIVVAAAARSQRQYSASANGPKYNAVIGKTKFITPIDWRR
jgi:hypothetical protein